MILLRRGKSAPVGSFEQMVAALAVHMGIPVEYRVPEGGRSAVYLRDYRMVDDADYVMAFFHAERVMEGGTAHVVEAALNRDKTVYAWSVTKEGKIDRVGELEAFLPGPAAAW